MVENSCPTDYPLLKLMAFFDAKQEMEVGNSCLTDDPLLKLMAFFDAKQEMEVYKKIDHIWKSSYESSGYDFAKTISGEIQLGKKFIDCETGRSLTKDGAGIGFSDQYATSHLLSWPKYHVLDQCNVGAPCAAGPIPGVILC